MLKEQILGSWGTESVYAIMRTVVQSPVGVYGGSPFGDFASLALNRANKEISSCSDSVQKSQSKRTHIPSLTVDLLG